MLFPPLNHQSQPLQLSPVLLPCGNHINSGSINTAVSQHICKLCDILINFIKTSGKQMAKVMRKYFIGQHPCFCCEPLHSTPDITSIHGISGFRDKYLAFFDSIFLNVNKQFFSQISRYHNPSVFSFAAYLCISQSYGLYGHKTQLTNPNSCTAYSLQDHFQPDITGFSGRLYQTYILLSR